jgi:hypothetical protein
MIKHFTTPEFADLLKEHGIEIDTPFYWTGVVNITTGYKLCVKPFEYINKEISIGWLPLDIVSNKIELLTTKPAYLLSEVLTWLPDTATIKAIPCELQVMDAQSGKFRYNGRTHNESVQRGYLSIEQLITQGLIEGWLTKEIIEQQINLNQ